MNINTLLIALVLGLAALALFLLGFLLLKTALFSPPQKEIKPRRFVGVDGKSVAERLGLAVQFKPSLTTTRKGSIPPPFLGCIGC